MQLSDVRDIIDVGKDISEKLERKRKIERYFYKDVLKYMKRKEAKNIILLGLRGIGKSTFLAYLNSKFENSYFIPVDYIVKYYGSSLKDFLKTFEKYILGGKTILLLDEVHYDKNFDSILKIVSDYKKNIFFVATGSSAIKLKMSPDLVRRVKTFEIFPFTFSEYLLLTKRASLEEIKRGKKIVLDLLKKRKPREIIRIKEKYLINYLEIGGFPDAFEENNYKVILDLIDKMILRDIQKIRKVEESKIKKILLYMSIAYEFSEETVGKIGMEKWEYYDLLDLLEDSSLVFPVYTIGTSFSKISRRGCKYFFYSSSIPASILKDVRKTLDYGKLLENEVAVTIKRAFGEVFLGKTKDFYFSGKEIEVKWGKRNVKGFVICNCDPEVSEKGVKIPKDLFLLL